MTLYVLLSISTDLHQSKSGKSQACRYYLISTVKMDQNAYQHRLERRFYATVEDIIPVHVTEERVSSDGFGILRVGSQPLVHILLEQL